ncbi:MAG: sporulation membrane protein YtaF [Clostridiales bacterium 43-6]|nr:MAG: sporulation membrane protein YtaF [Clostridiales bacterium 43-6]
MLFSLILLSVTLSFDALFLGLAFGINQKRIPLSSKLAICLCSVFYAGISIVAGRYLLLLFPVYIAKIIGAVLLALIGVSYLLKAIFPKEQAPQPVKPPQKEKKPVKIVIKSIEITIQILKNPDTADIDNSGTVDIKEALFIGTALSIDSVGVGIGSAMSGLHGWYIPLFIGLFQLCFLNIGQYLMKNIRFFAKNKRLAEILPGVLLVLLSIVRLMF